MQYLGKIKVKVSYGAGFNLLCLAAAGVLTVKTCNMIAEGVRASVRHKQLNELKEHADSLHKMAEEIYSKMKKEKENADEDIDVEEMLS